MGKQRFRDRLAESFWGFLLNALWTLALGAIVTVGVSIWALITKWESPWKYVVFTLAAVSAILVLAVLLRMWLSSRKSAKASEVRVRPSEPDPRDFPIYNAAKYIFEHTPIGAEMHGWEQARDPLLQAARRGRIRVWAKETPESDYDPEPVSVQLLKHGFFSVQESDKSGKIQYDGHRCLYHPRFNRAEVEGFDWSENPAEKWAREHVVLKALDFNWTLQRTMLHVADGTAFGRALQSKGMSGHDVKDAIEIELTRLIARDLLHVEASINDGSVPMPFQAEDMRGFRLYLQMDVFRLGNWRLETRNGLIVPDDEVRHRAFSSDAADGIRFGCDRQGEPIKHWCNVMFSEKEVREHDWSVTPSTPET